ncbi:MAG TPA: hypothetical protein VJN65_02660 [Bacteroidota bacterium]|nr:hypothetical protein [Bacteroidota bacterium]
MNTTTRDRWCFLISLLVLVPAVKGQQLVSREEWGAPAAGSFAIKPDLSLSQEGF